jgi:hypothetical protein
VSSFTPRAWASVVVPALLLSAAPVAADQAAAPAIMTSCWVTPKTIQRHGTPPPETIRVSFMIIGDGPADVVRFTANSPSGVHEFTVRGSFASSVTINNRELPVDPAAAVRPLPHGVDCMLTYVHYVDGTSWSAPNF